jgi:hypothetical protein
VWVCVCVYLLQFPGPEEETDTADGHRGLIREGGFTQLLAHLSHFLIFPHILFFFKKKRVGTVSKVSGLVY